MVRAAEAEDGRRPLERLGEVREGRDADPAADQHRTGHIEPEAVPERAEHGELVPAVERGDRRRPGPDRVDEEAELALRRVQSENGRGSTRPGASSMKNWPGRPARASPGERGRGHTGRSTRRPRRGAAHDAARQASGVAALLALLEREDGLRARVRDRLDGGAGGGEGRDARNARDHRRLPDRVAVAAGVAAFRRVDDQVDAAGAHERDDRVALVDRLHRDARQLERADACPRSRGARSQGRREPARPGAPRPCRRRGR